MEKDIAERHRSKIDKYTLEYQINVIKTKVKKGDLK